MADDVEPPEGPPAPSGSATRRWLRWGRVYVDIEPPQGPNPWTAAAGGAPVIEAPLAEPVAAPRRWRGVLIFSAACLFAAVLTALLVYTFGRHDRRAVFAAPATTTTRPPARVQPATSAPASPPSTSAGAPSVVPSSTVTTAPGSTGTTTVGGGRAGGPITVPEGIEPATTVAPSTVAPTTAPRRPVAPSTTTTTPSPQAFLGVTVQDSVDGAQVLEIFAGSGAEKAGLKAGDIVTAIDRSTIVTVDDLGVAILSHRPGDIVTVTVLRNGATTTVTATLGVRPAS
jgi:PDZ domain